MTFIETHFDGNRLPTNPPPPDFFTRVYSPVLGAKGMQIAIPLSPVQARNFGRRQADSTKHPYTCCGDPDCKYGQEPTDANRCLITLQMPDKAMLPVQCPCSAYTQDSVALTDVLTVPGETEDGTVLRYETLTPRTLEVRLSSLRWLVQQYFILLIPNARTGFKRRLPWFESKTAPKGEVLGAALPGQLPMVRYSIKEVLEYLEKAPWTPEQEQAAALAAAALSAREDALHTLVSDRKARADGLPNVRRLLVLETVQRVRAGRHIPRFGLCPSVLGAAAEIILQEYSKDKTNMPGFILDGPTSISEPLLDRGFMPEALEQEGTYTAKAVRNEVARLYATNPIWFASVEKVQEANLFATCKETQGEQRLCEAAAHEAVLAVEQQFAEGALHVYPFPSSRYA